MTTSPTSDDAHLQPAVAAEFTSLADLLAAASDAQWDTPSLCDGWRVREVVAHITMPFRYGRGRFALELARSRGRFNEMADRVARHDAAAMSTADLTRAVRSNIGHPWKPPGGGYTGALAHDLIHGLDITVPLGLAGPVPGERLRLILPASLTDRSVRFFGVNLDGIELRAEDMDWTFGSGAPLTGEAADLLLVLCGRTLPPGRLAGEPSARFSRPGRH